MIVITTHGYQDIFARYLREEKGLNAISERTQYEGETLNESEPETEKEEETEFVLKPASKEAKPKKEKN